MNRHDLEALGVVAWLLLFGAGCAFIASALVTATRSLWWVGGACLLGCAGLTYYWSGR